jgi:AcrR family transcriptional regulator
VHHLPPPRVKTGNPIMDRFLAATYTVTARSGYEKASAHRISRVAGLAFSHVYNHFDTKEELTRHAAKVLIDEFRFLAVRALHVHDRAEYTLNVMRVMRGLWDEESLSASRLRAEIILAARHHGPLGDTMREGFIETWRTTVANLPDGVAPTAAYMNLLICINGLGMSLLALAFPSGRNLDMTPIASEWGRAMDALRRDMGIPPTTGSA